LSNQGGNRAGRQRQADLPLLSAQFGKIKDKISLF
jgi:hypothetical protein